MVSRQGRRAVLGIFVAVVLALVCSQVPKAVSAEPFEGIMQAITGAAQGEPEPQAIDEAFGVDMESAQVPPAALTANAPSVSGDGTDADAVDPEMGVDAGDGEAASDDEANADSSDQQQAVVPSAPSRFAYQSPSRATDNSGVRVSLYEYWDGTKTASGKDTNKVGPAYDENYSDVNKATEVTLWPNMGSDWTRTDYAFAFGDYGYADWNRDKNSVTKNIAASNLDGKDYPSFSTEQMRKKIYKNEEGAWPADVKDMRYLFSENTYAKAYEDVPGLFGETTGNGHYRYDSASNFAEFDYKNPKNGFTLKDGPNKTAVNGSTAQFMPFNTLEGLTKGTEDRNYAFGMKVEADFRQPENGITSAGEHMVFNFSGDDDVWVYIDDALVLDIGGVHGVKNGSIDFATGKVVVDGMETTLDAMLKAAGVEAELNENGTFKDFSNHTMKMFYLERGHGGSNCMLDFNLETVPEGSVDVYKRITDFNGDPQAFSDASFTIRVDVAETDEGKEPNSEAYQPYVGAYQIWEGNQKVKESTTTADAPNITLMNGQHVRLLNVPKTSWYKVTELAGDGYNKDDYEFDPGDAGVVENAGENEIGQSNPIYVAKDPSVTVRNKFKAKDNYSFVVEKKMANGQVAPANDTFEMTVTNGQGEPYVGNYYLTNEDGDFDTTATPTESGKITLKAGQRAKIVGVAPGTTFKVEERLLDGYNTPSYSDNDSYEGANKADGQVTVDNRIKDKEGVVTVTNTLKTTPATVEASFPVKKVLKGRDWKDSESFTFVVKATGYKASTDEENWQEGDQIHASVPTPSAKCVVNKPIDGNWNTANFGELKFTQPGMYRYKVTEDIEGASADLKMSEAVYEVVYVVNGPDEEGKLSIANDSPKITMTTNDEGNAIGANDQESVGVATFTNSLVTGNLSLTKRVSGTAADKYHHFNFELSTTADEIKGKTFNLVYATSEDANYKDTESGVKHPTSVTFGEDGKATFSVEGNAITTLPIRHGETVTIGGLSAGTVTIKETNPGQGTTVKSQVSMTDLMTRAASETESTDTITADIQSSKLTAVTFTNTTDHNPDLGIRSNATPFLAMAGTAGAAVAAAAAIRIRGRVKRD